MACTYFRLNSIQMAVLLSQEKIPKTLVDAAVRMAESVADELTRADGREVNIKVIKCFVSCTDTFINLVQLSIYRLL